MGLKVTYLTTAKLDCDTPGCQGKGSWTAETLREALQAASKEGWSLWPGQHYCPSCGDAHQPSYTEFGGTMDHPKFRRVPVERREGEK